VKTGDPKIDAVLDQIERRRIIVSDPIRKEIEDLAGALDGLPAGVREEDRQDTLALLRKHTDKIMADYTTMVDPPFIESEQNEKYDYEDGQGNLVTRETDAKSRIRDTITATRTELAERRARQGWANDELAEAKELFKQADDFVKAAAGTGGAQAEALKARADELRTEARAKRQALRDAGVKLRPTVEEVMRERKVATGEVAAVLEAFRSGRYQEAVDAAKALNRVQLHELNAVANESDHELIDFLKRASSDDMTARAAAGGVLIREGY
jgi:hypothetical protein